LRIYAGKFRDRYFTFGRGGIHKNGVHFVQMDFVSHNNKYNEDYENCHMPPYQTEEGEREREREREEQK
jgi:hypothetical protein